MSKVKARVLELLDVFKNSPCLWDKSHKDYRNQVARKEAYKVLFEIYKTIYKYANVKGMTKKIQNMRTNYIKELKKVRQRGSAYKPTLFYYDAFSFINENLDMHEFEDTEETQIVEKEEYTFQSFDDGSDYEASSPPAPLPPKRTRTAYNRFDTHSARDAKDSSIHSTVLSEVYGKSVGLQLRDLDKRQLTIAQKLISDTIYYAKMGRLSENSSISLGPPVTPISKTPSYFVTLKTPSQVTSSTPRVCRVSDSSISKQHVIMDPLIKDEPENNRVSDCEEETEYLEIDEDF